MVVTLSLEQFKAVILQNQNKKKKVETDYKNYISDRTWRIRKRCKY